MKKQIPLEAVAALLILIVAAAGYFLLVKPKQDAAGELETEIAELDTMIQVAVAAAKAPPPGDEDAIEVADVFRLTKAMPDIENMPGIMLELNTVAAATGIEFVSISVANPEVRTGYSVLPISLTFEGNYFDLLDFLLRLRNLVSVRDGTLEAEGRLFLLDTLDMAQVPEEFPLITASLSVLALIYSTDVPGAPAALPAPTEGAGGETTPAEGEGEERPEPVEETP